MPEVTNAPVSVPVETPAPATTPQSAAPQAKESPATTQLTQAVAQPTDWRTELPDELRNHAAFKDFKSLGDVAKSYIEKDKMIGADKLVIPKDDAPQTEWDAFYAKQGRPEKATDYKLTDVKVPEGLPQNDDFKNDMLAEMHKAGLNQRQANQLFQAYQNKTGGLFQSMQVAKAQQNEEGLNSLRQEWGGKFDENLNFSRLAVEHFGGDDLKSELSDTGAGNSPTLIKTFAMIGKSMSEDKIMANKSGSMQFGGMTPDQARYRIGELQGDPQFMKRYQSAGEPGHKEAVAEMERHFQIAYKSAPRAGAKQAVAQG